ncbi:MAG: leucine-rich repeat domain-containing protein [Ruminococcus sp.]|nr:leucine-rich repeat domain-containing protein [Ruminococcus sp.]
MKKQVISSLLALSLVFGTAAVLPQGAVSSDSVLSAAAKTYKADGYEYELLDDGTVYLKKYTGGQFTVNIPSSIDGKTVTRLGNLLFNGNKNVKEITVPDTITSYDNGSVGGNGIFRKCTSLTKITLPSNMTIIPKYCFEGCTALRSITLPSDITEVCYASFANCSGLEKIEIPSKVTWVNAIAFQNCTSLETIYIPDTCTKVGASKSSLHEWDPFKGIENSVTIITEPGSAAETFAKDYGRNYRLKKVSIKGAKITGVKSKTYTGKAVKLDLTVKLGGKTLINGTDYTVTYNNNTKVGTAKVNIKGKGGYEGKISKTFKIKPAKTAVKKLTSPKAKKLKVTYKKAAGAGKYQITYSTSKKYTAKTTKTATTTKLTKTISKLKSGKTYYVKVRAVKTVKGIDYKSKYSAVKKIKVK